MIRIVDRKENEDDIKVVGGYISLSDFNRMKNNQRRRFVASIRRAKINRLFL
jgi:hypothetical protein